MYTPENLKQDLLANLKGDPSFSPKVANILSYSEFKFNDSNSFTRIQWNTYQRDLVIFCAPSDRIELEKYKNSLFSLCDKIHGTQDDYILMSLEIMAKSSLSTSSILTDEVIVIRTDISIDRTNNQIGKGGFGKVYQYYDEQKEEVFAYKIYEPNIFQDSEPAIMKKRFLREGKKLLNYSHTNVVKAFDYGFLGNASAYIKMEFISGQRLSDYVLQNSPLSKALKEKLCHEYISGMAYVHSKTDMHRDISYSNVMVNSNNEIKILDFGFSRNKDDSNYDTTYKDINRKFVLPNEPYTFQTEVFCIGAILYTIITNSIFDFSHINDLDLADCDQKLIDATKICLSENPDNRFAEAISLRDYVSSSPVYTIPKNFSLDEFRDLINRGIKIQFMPSCLPKIEDIKQWIEHSLNELIESHAFLSTINLINFIEMLPNVREINQLINSSYMINKELFKSILDFYTTANDVTRNLFLKGILTIILESSDDFELPFN